jgi:ketosteroid isomerase-like protein
VDSCRGHRGDVPSVVPLERPARIVTRVSSSGRDGALRFAAMGGSNRTVATVVVTTLGLSAGYRWAVRRFFTEVMRRVDAGDPRLLLMVTAPDVHFTFPGTSTWAIDTHDRSDLERWVRRTASVGLVHEPQQILLSGPPWNLLVAVRLTDQCTASDGRLVYDNIAVIVARARFGRVVEFETFLDMDRIAALDEYAASLS